MEGMRPTTLNLTKMAAGMRPRDGQGKSQMAVYMSCVSAFLKAELAIVNTRSDGEDVTQYLSLPT
jgi:hypothetical protein